MFLLRSQGKNMPGATTIEWTDATWNPVTGCTKISAGCDHCYAERFSERFRGTAGHPFETGFDLTLRPERLEQPLRWRQPRMIFVNSMSDLFHKEIPRPFVSKVFDIMEQANWHTFQVLTKRSSLMRDFLRQRYGTERGPVHMWFGVSVEDGCKTSRIRHLRDAPAGVREGLIPIWRPNHPRQQVARIERLRNPGCSRGTVRYRRNFGAGGM
jgi:protein gp37